MKFAWYRFQFLTSMLNFVLLLLSRSWMQALRDKTLKFLSYFVWRRRQLKMNDREQGLEGSIQIASSDVASFVVENELLTHSKPFAEEKTCCIKKKSMIFQVPIKYVPDDASIQQQQYSSQLILQNIDLKFPILTFNFEKMAEHLNSSGNPLVFISLELYNRPIVTRQLTNFMSPQLLENICKGSHFRKSYENNVKNFENSPLKALLPQSSEPESELKLELLEPETSKLPSSTPPHLSNYHSSDSFVISRRTQKRKHCETVNFDIDKETLNSSPFMDRLNREFTKKSPVFQLKLNHSQNINNNDYYYYEDKNNFGKSPSTPFVQELNNDHVHEMKMTGSTPKMIHSYFQEELKQKRSQERLWSTRKEKRHSISRTKMCPMSIASRSRRVAREIIEEGEQDVLEERELLKSPPSKTLKMYEPRWKPKHIIHNSWDIVVLKNDWELLLPIVFNELDHGRKLVDDDGFNEKEVNKEEKSGQDDHSNQIYQPLTDGELIQLLVLQRFSLSNNVLTRKRLLNKKKKKINLQVSGQWKENQKMTKL